jgi:hypothetical protein
VDAWWTSSLERALGGVERLPRATANLLAPHAPRASHLVAKLQVDAPLITTFAAACILVQALVGPAAKARYFAVSKSLEASPASLFSVVGQARASKPARPHTARLPSLEQAARVCR